jgi:putative hemolysin
MMHAVLDFGEMVVRQLMLPRTEVVALQADTPFDEIVEFVTRHPLTKFPVYEENLDEIIGILHVKRILSLMGKTEANHSTARDLARDAVFVPETLPVNVLLHRFRDRRQHIAIVLDEYGGTAGLITLEDLMEEIVGEVSDPFDPPIPEIRALPDGSYLIDGLSLIEDVNMQLNLDLEDPNYDTIAGYVLGVLGSIPKEGDIFDVDSLRFRIEKMDNLRVEQISLVLLESARGETGLT